MRRGRTEGALVFSRSQGGYAQRARGACGPNAAVVQQGDEPARPQVRIILFGFGRSATMTSSDAILRAMDQGTSSSRAIAFSTRGAIVALDQHPFEQIYPASGWVEHDPEAIWATRISTAR